MAHPLSENPAFVVREGAYRRELRITAMDGSVTAEMGDDIHHLAVRLEHSDGIVAKIVPTIHRIPWTTCPSATVALLRLQGRRLASPLAFADPGDRGSSCTHLLDLANICAARAGGPPLIRHYRIAVELFDGGSAHGRLSSDHGCALDWAIANNTIRSSDSYDGLSDTILPRLLSDRDIEESEPALIMRRAMHIAGCRALDLDLLSGPYGAGQMPPSCYSYLPENAAVAGRNLGTFVDFAKEDRWPLDR